MRDLITRLDGFIHFARVQSRSHTCLNGDVKTTVKCDAEQIIMIFNIILCCSKHESHAKPSQCFFVGLLINRQFFGVGVKGRVGDFPHIDFKAGKKNGQLMLLLFPLSLDVRPIFYSIEFLCECCFFIHSNIVGNRFRSSYFYVI